MRAYFALHRIAVGVIGPVVLDRVDEEQAQHLDAQGREALFLFQMLMDRAADHQPLQRIGIHVAHRLAGLEKRLAAGQLALPEAGCPSRRGFRRSGNRRRWRAWSVPQDRRRPERPLPCGGPACRPARRSQRAP